MKSAVWITITGSFISLKKGDISYNCGNVLQNILENSPKKAAALIGQKSCLYNSMETQN